MKKVLVLMGAFLAFAACQPMSDCDCTASTDMMAEELFTEEAATLVDFEGTCDEVTFEDLTGEWAELYPAADAEAYGFNLSCVER